MIALIPARGGSKGVPGKNLLPILGKPLIAWSIEQAKCAAEVDRVIVSTDCHEIAKVARSYGAEVPGLRPAEHATDEASTESVMLHCIENWCPTLPVGIVLLQPTSPLRSRLSIDSAVRQFRRDMSDSLVSVVKQHSFFWVSKEKPVPNYDIYNRPRRQDIIDADTTFRETGSIYITSTELLLSSCNRLGGNISLFVQEEWESLEIDTKFDYELISKIAEQYENNI